MSMSADPDRVHRDGQRVGIADDKILFTGGNIEAREERVMWRHLHSGEGSLRRFPGKIKSDSGLLRLGLAGGVEMVLHHQV